MQYGVFIPTERVILVTRNPGGNPDYGSNEDY